MRGVADRLPFPDGTFDAAMALLTVHHWPHPLAGLRDYEHVTNGPIVILTFDKDIHERQWLVTDYLPTMAELDMQLPSPATIANELGGGVVEVLPVPHDWRRRLLPRLVASTRGLPGFPGRAGISGIARLPSAVVDRGMAQLEADLASGAWDDAHQDLITTQEIDAGYRIVVSGGD